MSQKIRNIITISFLSIALLTSLGAIVSNLGLFGLDSNSRFAQISLGAILVEIISALILVWKAGLLKEIKISAVIKFPNNIDFKDFNLDPDACTYEVRNSKAEVRCTGKLAVVWGNGGWNCILPTPLEQDDSVIFKLKERSGVQWEVRPFYPLSKDVEALKI